MPSDAQSFDRTAGGTTRRTDPHPRSPRDAACRLIASQAERFPDLLPLTPDLHALDPRDALLASALADATLRRWITLRHLIAPFLHRPIHTLHPAASAALFVGAAQLLLFDRIPDHAAIYESVEWAKRNAPPRTVPLVNAILRRVARSRARPPQTACWDSPLDALSAHDALPLADGRFLPLTAPLDALADPTRRIAVLTSHREGLIARWIEHFGLERAAATAAHDLVISPIILNATAAPPELLAHLQEEGLASPHDDHDRLVWTGPPSELTPLLARHDECWVQDPTSASPVEAVRQSGFEPELIVDACAGRGTKTRQLLHAFPSARVVASDTDDERLRRLAQDLMPHPRLSVVPASALRDHVPDGAADLLLLDVPCSNTGVLARRLEARYRFSASGLRRLVALQRRIISTNAPLLGPRARLLYTTCSLEPEENHALVRETASLGLRIEDEAFTLPEGLPGGDPAHYRDGGYRAILSRERPAAPTAIHSMLSASPTEPPEPAR